MRCSSTAATAATAAPAAARQPDPRSAWLAARAAPLRTLDLADADDADLAPLGRAVAGRRIVLLGEQTHGDGATFEAKARIIRYLHERHGFDLLVFESGLYDCRRTWVDARAGVALADSAGGCMFALWSNSAEVRPLLQYLDEAESSARPLELAGMDFQPSGSNAGRLCADLARFLAGQPDSSGTGAAAEGVCAPYRLLFGSPREFRALPDSVRGVMRRSLARLAAWPLQDVPALGAMGEAAFWRQAIAGAGALAEFVWAIDPARPDPAVFNRRDSVMAANLLWLARQDPARKIIVWAATSHLVRERARIQDVEAPQMVPAGHLVAADLPGETYTIGFLAAEGEFGFARPGTTRPSEPVPPAEPGTLEALWRDSGQEWAFLDLRGLPAGGEWLREPVAARPMGYGVTRAAWGEHLDGFVFTRRMTPARPVRTAP